LNTKIDTADQHVRLYITDSLYFEFRLPVPIKELMYLVMNDGYFVTPEKRYLISDGDLNHDFHIMYAYLKHCFSGNFVIPDAFFEKGLSYYRNVIEYHTLEEEDIKVNTFSTDEFELFNDHRSLSFWQVSEYIGYQTWMYSYQGRVWIEIGKLYAWDECDQEDYDRCYQFIKNYAIQRYEISLEMAQQWIDSLIYVCSFSDAMAPILFESISSINKKLQISGLTTQLEPGEIEQFFVRCEARGEARGKAYGEQKNKYEMLHKFQAEGFSLKRMSRLTDLSVKEIQRLLQNSTK
jgi:hypothetical protein